MVECENNETCLFASMTSSVSFLIDSGFDHKDQVTYLLKWDINKYDTSTSLTSTFPLELILSCCWWLHYHQTQIVNSQNVLSHFIYFTATDNWYRGFGPGSACFVAVICLSVSHGRIFHDPVRGQQHAPCIVTAPLSSTTDVFIMLNCEEIDK